MVAVAMNLSQSNKNNAAAEQDDAVVAMYPPEANKNNSAAESESSRHHILAATARDLWIARSSLPGTLLFLFVAICVCADPSLAIQDLGHRDMHTAAMAVSSHSQVMEDLIVGSNDVMITEGFKKRRGYKDLYKIMDLTRKQSMKVRNKAEDVMSRIPDTVNAVEQELKKIPVRAKAMEKYFDEEPEEIIVFLQSLSSSLNKVIALVDEEARLWEELHGEMKSLRMKGSKLHSRLNVFLSTGDGRVLGRHAELARLKVTDGDRIAGGLKATGTAVALAYGVCAMFPALAVPAGAALTVSLNWVAHERARDFDAQHDQVELVYNHMDSIVENVQKNLPTYLESVKQGTKRIKAVSKQLTALRDIVGDANMERLRMMENRRATRTAMARFVGFLAGGINDIEGVRKLVLLGREQLAEHGAEPLGGEGKGE